MEETVYHVPVLLKACVDGLQVKPDGVYADRVIDVDLLLCFDEAGGLVRMERPELTLPHPLMHLRDFVMKPLAEIAPEVVRRLFPAADGGR